MACEPLYSIGTWDTESQSYTPQVGVTKTFNMTLAELRTSTRQLKELGYSCHRYRDEDGGHENNDSAVLVERTDGKSEEEILKEWKR